jgi:hypothetical protein
MAGDRRSEPRVVATDTVTLMRRAGGGRAIIVRVVDLSTRGISIELTGLAARDAVEFILEMLTGATPLELPTLSGPARQAVVLRWAANVEIDRLRAGGLLEKPIADPHDLLAASRRR